MDKFLPPKISQRPSGASVSLEFVIIISVYNEANVIIKKLESILQQDYPNSNISVFLGSDNSSDPSNDLIQSFVASHDNFHFFPFTARRGKINVINELVEKAKQHKSFTDKTIIVFTDANVILDRLVLSKFANHFENDNVAVVDTQLFGLGMQAEGISHSEQTYLSLESKIKHLEGKLFGLMLGTFGGCYAIRSSYFEPVPSNFLVDDFFITLSAIEKGGLAINDLQAKVYEGLPQEISEEFRRKARISAGNFQNLNHFLHFLNPKNPIRAYIFFSHKVLRWIGPFLILGFLTTSFILSWFSPCLFWDYLFGVLSVLFIFIPILDWLLCTFDIHLKKMRNTRYFVWMNIALLLGFINYVKGIRNSFWDPPRRTKVN